MCLNMWGDDEGKKKKRGDIAAKSRCGACSLQQSQTWHIFSYSPIEPEVRSLCNLKRTSPLILRWLQTGRNKGGEQEMKRDRHGRGQLTEMDVSVSNSTNLLIPTLNTFTVNRKCDL